MVLEKGINWPVVMCVRERCKLSSLGEGGLVTVNHCGLGGNSSNGNEGWKLGCCK